MIEYYEQLSEEEQDDIKHVMTEYIISSDLSSGTKI